MNNHYGYEDTLTATIKHYQKKVLLTQRGSVDFEPLPNSRELNTLILSEKELWKGVISKNTGLGAS
jgi:hypothetical protein